MKDRFLTVDSAGEQVTGRATDKTDPKDILWPAVNRAAARAAGKQYAGTSRQFAARANKVAQARAAREKKRAARARAAAKKPGGAE